MFDVISYLDARHIDHSTSGKNVTQGWVNICCIYCDDLSNHLGINLTSGIHHCWKCGCKGGPEKLVMQIDRVSFIEAKRVLERFTTHGQILSIPTPRNTSEYTKLPPGTTKDLPTLHKTYLVNRGFDPEALQTMYDIRACDNIGHYRKRLIIPIYLNNQLVNFIARDCTNVFKKRYLMAPMRDIYIPRDHLMYGIDLIKTHNVVICEGVFDAWRIGPGAVATFGTRVTESQLRLLVQKRIEHAYVIFDKDASKTYGLALAKKLQHIIPHVDNIELPHGDPDSYFLDHVSDLHTIRTWIK